MANIKEIARVCKENYLLRCAQVTYMRSYAIYYVAILADGELRFSSTPDILDEASKCYLIHYWSQLAETCWYSTFNVQSINEHGEVGEGRLDADYYFTFHNAYFNNPPRIVLKRNNTILYNESIYLHANTLHLGLETEIKNIWYLYGKCKKECKTEFESKLLCNLVAKERNLEELKRELESKTAKEKLLEEELSKYRTLLDDIKKLLETKNS